MTTTSQTAFKLPPVVAAHSTMPDPLESLRSPQVNQSFNDKHPGRDSIATTEFKDIALDDESFSPIALTARTDLPEPEPDSEETEGTPSQSRPGEDVSSRPRSASFSSSQPPSFPAVKGHRKTASTTTIRSVHEPGLSLFMSRLDLQDDGARSRGSVDGQLKLQEEFARLQERETKERNIVAEGGIDWGE